MISIGKNDVKYSVNKEKRTVVAYVDGTAKMFEEFLEDNKAPLPSEDSYWYGIPVKRMPNHFSAKAVCSPDDEWDEELGKRIAFDRLKNKINYSFFARADNYINLMNKKMTSFVERLNNYNNKLHNCARYRAEKIEEVLANK